MKLMRTSSFIILGLIVLATAGIVGCGASKSKPKDTPIVAGGGSIHVHARPADAEGWLPIVPKQRYSTSLRPGVKNPQGIDYLSFENFIDAPSPDPLTDTNGWAITMSNVDAQGHKKEGAIKFCSDPSCGASRTTLDGSPNPDLCAVTLKSDGPVYAEVRADSEWKESTASFGLDGPIQDIHFHDRSSSCDSTDTCDRIFDVLVETCNGATYRASRCSPPGECSVTVGKDH